MTFLKKNMKIFELYSHTKNVSTDVIFSKTLKSHSLIQKIMID